MNSMQFNSKEDRKMHVCIKCSISFPVRIDFLDNQKEESKRCICGEIMFPYEPVTENKHA